MAGSSIFPNRVLMTGDPLSGVWTYALNLARGLQQFDVHVALATMGRPLYREQRRLARGIHNLEIYESSYRLEWMEDPWRDIRVAGEWLLRLEEETAPDLIHLNSCCFGQLPFKTSTLVAAHIDVFGWWRAVHGQLPPEAWTRYREETTRGLQAAGLVVATTRAALDGIEKSFGLIDRVRVIPNGRYPERNLGGPRRTPREELIVTAGRLWDEGKNIHALDRVAPRLSWPVVAIGSCRSPEGVETRFERISVPGKDGELPQEQLFSQLARASIFALPTRHETFGYSVLEAALSGCALVLGDIPGLRELWQDAAIFVSPDDDQALEGAIELLIGHPAAREEYSRRAWERARFFNADRMASAYFQEYRRLMRPPLPQDRYLGI